MAQLQAKKDNSTSNNLFHKKIDRNVYALTGCIYVIESKSLLKRNSEEFLEVLGYVYFYSYRNWHTYSRRRKKETMFKPVP